MTPALDALFALFAATGKRPTPRFTGFVACCPCHADSTPSLSVNPGHQVPVVVHCHACGDAVTIDDVLEQLGASDADHALILGRNGNGTARAATASARRFDYADEAGVVQFRVERRDHPDGSKTFAQFSPDANGAFHPGLNGARRVPFRLPECRAALAAGAVLHVAEGEKDVLALEGLTLSSTCNPGGAGKWHASYTVDLLAGIRPDTVRIIVHADNDAPGEKHAASVADSFRRVGVADVKIVRYPDLGAKADVADFLESIGSLSVDEKRAKLEERIASAAFNCHDVVTIDAPPVTIDHVVATFRRHIYLPDDDPLLAVLATIVANRQPGDPVWLLIVGPSSAGKTEILRSLRGVPGLHESATLTEAALLSGSPKRERAKDANGGLLREIGDRGTVVFKDFGSVLSMNRDARTATLAALREIYDGSWTRHVGTDGGRSLSWSGHVGFIGGCTPALDGHHAVMSSLGERFLLLRLAQHDDDGLDQLTGRALDRDGTTTSMRDELAATVSSLLAGVDIGATPPALAPNERAHLIATARLVAVCRSPVEREGYSREIELVPGAEVPARLAIALKRLFVALLMIGADRARAWRIVLRVALDCVPATRLRCLRAVAAIQAAQTTDVATQLGLPSGTTRRALEDLAAYGLLRRSTGGRSDTWALSPSAAKLFTSVPEMSDGIGSAHSEDRT